MGPAIAIVRFCADKHQSLDLRGPVLSLGAVHANYDWQRRLREYHEQKGLCNSVKKEDQVGHACYEHDFLPDFDTFNMASRQQSKEKRWCSTADLVPIDM